MENFPEWVQAELDKRGWSRLEASRRAEVSASMFDKVINGYANPGPDFCTGVARAFSMPVETVFRHAGLLPEIHAPMEDMTFQEVYDLMRNLTPRERRDVLEYTKLRYRLLKEEQAAYETKRGRSP
jgi:transcriptional regulator with XRE-family HTH domain